MTPDEITSLIFTHNSVFGIQIQSRISQADSIFPIKILPLALARALNDLKNPVWTIHFYPTHAELWLSTHWNESHSRRLNVINESRLRVQHHNDLIDGQNILNELTYKVLKRMEQHRLPIGIGAAQLTAYSILSNTIPMPAVIELGLTDLYQVYGNKANTEQAGTTDTSTEAEAGSGSSAATDEGQAV